MADKNILLLRETIAESIISDVVTVITLVVIIALAVYVFKSEAMQWVGGIMFFLWLLARAARIGLGRTWRSPQEAADYLRDKYGATASSVSEKSNESD